MIDVHTVEQRSRNMAAIRSRDTKPEKAVRSLLHSLGFRFRLHRKDLPGKPDIVLPKHRTVIFVHGCFWHCHDCKEGLVVARTRADFWAAKRQGNVARDANNVIALEKAGWRVLIIWECETKPNHDLVARLAQLGFRSAQHHCK
jgi:DNA mismatch endonuclease, patch repair protein